MITVGIVGGSGYTGVQLISLLLGHPEARIAWVTSRKFKGAPVHDTFGAFRGLTDLVFVEFVPELLNEVDIVFTAVPHGQAMEIVARIVKAGKRVIDLSADFRFSDPRLYEQAYQKHLAPHLAKEAVYGLPELFEDTIKSARVVGNPGCYPTSAILAAAPALANALLQPDGTLIVDSKSGVSGAGRGASLGTHFCEVNEGMRPYKVLGHRHQPEIGFVLRSISRHTGKVFFTPHLIPMNRGIVSTVYIPLARRMRRDEIQDLYEGFYRDKPFVRVLPEGLYPSTHEVRGSNYCDVGLTVSPDGTWLVAIAAIDNLIKGASGQAVQNMNLMTGLDETLGLKSPPLFP